MRPACAILLLLTLALLLPGASFALSLKILRSSTGLDRHSRRQNLEAWQVPLLPANATTRFRRQQSPPSGAGV